MTARPEPVVLDDLGHPRYVPEAQELIDAGAAMAPLCPLTVDGVLGAAVDQTGLDDFGPDGFREPLDVLLSALRAEAGLSAFGTVAMHTMLTQFAKNRLLLADLLRRHPEIHDIEVRAPIVIAGQPRTGTTHLQNLLGADPALRTLPYWEAVEPVLAPHEVPDPGEPDPRLARTADSVAFADLALPHLCRMHEMTVEHVHEEIHLLAMDFSTMLFDTLATMPSWRDWYRATDQRPHYRYLRTVLQALTFLRGGERWVLKSPQHMEQLPALLDVFPDATFVITHRDPVAVTTSAVTLVAYTQRLNRDSLDLPAMGEYWGDLMEQMLTACLRDRDLVPAEQSIDLTLHRFMADQEGTLAAVYERAGQPLDDAARAGHAQYLAGHVRDRHGRVHYDPTPFRFDHTARRSAFDRYTRRFAVEEEA